MPHKRPIAIPPAPGLSVTQIAPHKFRFHWWFLSMPANCRPARITLRVDAGGANPPFGPNMDLKVTRSSGTYTLNVPTFIKPVRGFASAMDAIGARSSITFVPIRR